MTELPVIDDSMNNIEMIVFALVDMGSITLISPIRKYSGGVHPDRCRVELIGYTIVVALSYDSLKALIMEKQVHKIMMSPQHSQ